MWIPSRAGLIAAVFSAAATLAAANLTAAQRGKAAQAPSITPFDPPRLRISVTAVEIDAVVTDRDGRRITDLRPDEFEIEQDGRKQAVISARYVTPDPSPAPDAGAAATTGDSSARASSTISPSAPRRDDERRTMAIVIDDFGLTFESANRMRKALTLFINRSVRPDDLVTIIRLGEDSGRSQTFTGDKGRLLKAASRMRYNIMSAADAGNDRGGKFQREFYTFRALDSLRVLIEAMRVMPGRKGVLMVNEGFAIVKRESGSPVLSPDPQVVERLRNLIDEASRSFVVIYALDARGGAFAVANAEVENLWSTYEGPEQLAMLSGGLFFHNVNDLSAGLSQALEDQQGYYLVGYQPDDETFKKDKKQKPVFHTVKVRVTRPGATVRSRSGFFGVTDAESSVPPK